MPCPGQAAPVGLGLFRNFGHASDSLGGTFDCLSNQDGKLFTTCQPEGIQLLVRQFCNLTFLVRDTLQIAIVFDTGNCLTWEHLQRHCRRQEQFSCADCACTARFRACHSPLHSTSTDLTPPPAPKLHWFLSVNW